MIRASWHHLWMKINSPSGRGWIQPRPLDRSMLLLTSTGWAFDVISWLTHVTIILMNWKCRAYYNFILCADWPLKHNILIYKNNMFGTLQEINMYTSRQSHMAITSAWVETMALFTQWRTCDMLIAFNVFHVFDMVWYGVCLICNNKIIWHIW